MPQAQTFLHRIRRRVLIPLALAWVLGTSLGVAVSYASTAQAFDRGLLDQGSNVVGLLRVEEGQVKLAPTAVELQEARPAGLPRFAVYQGGEFVAGDAGLRPQAVPDGAQRAFENVDLRSIRVRKLTLRQRVPAAVTIVVAQDLREREEWLKRLVAYSIVPQLVLLLILGWWLGHSLADEVAPLTRLQRELDQRGTGDLQPLPADRHHSFEIAMLTRAVNGLLERIDRSVRSQRQFAADVAHELRTPLAGVRSLADHALSSQDPRVWRDHLGQVLVSSDRAARTVEQLLHLAVAAEAQTVLHLEPLRLDELVRDVMLNLMHRADAAGVDLGAEGLEVPVTVLANSQLLEGILRNLVDNALRYGRPADPGQQAWVTVSLASRGDDVTLSVIDNGRGLTEEEARRVLGRWERGAGRDTKERERGTGLGLSIVVHYCELMGIGIGVHSHQGEGVNVRLTLKRAQ